MQSPVDHQKWIQRCKEILFNGEGRAKTYWERATPETREIILFSAKPKLKARHIHYAWDDFNLEEMHALWLAIKRIQRISEETALLVSDDFKNRYPQLSKQITDTANIH
ncbi:hypothetical protein ACLEC1_14695 [Lonsdalea quercina]|uniref:hypothetical protein n=1 Tax=Lonsdalea quercina TaxID=71657 RepID=UPI003976A1EA